MPLLGVVAGLTLATAQVPTGQTKGPSRDDSSAELLLLDVLYDHLRLDNALPALQDSHGKRFLPMRQLGIALGFRLRVEPSKHLASGFLGDPSDRIAMNGFLGKFVHKGKPLLFDPTLCFERDGDLYLDAETLSKSTGLHFDWKLNRLELNVTSDAPLPIEQQWIQRQIMARQGAPRILPVLPVVKSPYSLWGVPSIDMQLYSDATVQNKVAQNDSRLQVEGRGDLFFLSARYRFISAGPNEHPAALFSLGREDPQGRLLGPLHATQFAFGDLPLAQEPLFERSRNGLGATLSNFPLIGSQTGAPSSLDGHSPARSTVELYRGTELLATVKADEKGQYAFQSIPLDSGPNDLRIVVITPDGDVQEEQRTLYGDASGPMPGQSQYRLTAARVGDSIVPHSLSSLSQDQRRLEYIAEYRYGLSTSSWLSSTAADADGEGFMGIGFHAWGGESLWHLESMLSGNGGSALAAGISRRLGHATVSLEHTLATSVFGADLAPELGTDATQITKLRIDGAAVKSGHPIGYGLSLDRVNGSDPSTLVRARVSGSDGRNLVSNTLALRTSHDPLDVTGLFQARHLFGGAIGRLDLGYGFGRERGLQSTRLTLDRRVAENYRIRYGLDYDSTRVGSLETVGALYRVFGPLELGLNLALDTRGALKANFLFSVGLEGEGALRTMALARPGAAETGSIAVRVYLDKNLDGKFDEGDVLLPNIGFLIGGRTSIVKTGKDGTCFIDRLPTNQEITLTLNDDSFEDPAWAPATPGVLVIPRTGHLVHIDLGVIEAGEIEGRAIAAEPIKLGLTAELVNAAGKVVQTSVLDDDMTYVFSQVRPGSYTLRLVDPNGRNFGSRPLQVAAGARIKDLDFKVTSR